MLATKKPATETLDGRMHQERHSIRGFIVKKMREIRVSFFLGVLVLKAFPVKGVHAYIVRAFVFCFATLL